MNRLAIITVIFCFILLCAWAGTVARYRDAFIRECMLDGLPKHVCLKNWLAQENLPVWERDWR